MWLNSEFRKLLQSGHTQFSTADFVGTTKHCAGTMLFAVGLVQFTASSATLPMPCEGTGDGNGVGDRGKAVGGRIPAALLFLAA
jgi:hypothetical protein